MLDWLVTSCDLFGLPCQNWMLAVAGGFALYLAALTYLENASRACISARSTFSAVVPANGVRAKRGPIISSERDPGPTDMFRDFRRSPAFAGDDSRWGGYRVAP